MPFSRRLAILENEISGDILFKTRFLIILEKLVAEPASDQLSGILSSIEHAVSLCVCSGWLWSRPQCSAIVTAILANAEHYFGISTDFYDDNQKLKMTNRILTDKLNLFRQLETDVDRDKYLKQCSLDPRNLQLSEECIGQGGFSKVFIASYNGGPVAVKKIDTSDKIQVEIAKREAFMLQKLYPVISFNLVSSHYRDSWIDIPREFYFCRYESCNFLFI